MAEKRAKSRYIGRKCSMLFQTVRREMIEMTDADIVRAPFFKHHINEIIGNRVGMVVALVQLYLFLRTPAVDAGGSASCTPQSRSSASIENGEVKKLFLLLSDRRNRRSRKNRA